MQTPQLFTVIFLLVAIFPLSAYSLRLSDFGLARLLRVTEMNKDPAAPSGGTFSPATTQTFAAHFEANLAPSGSFTNLGLVNVKNDQSFSPNPPSFGSGSISSPSPELLAEKLPPKPPSFASRLSSRSSTEEVR